MIKLISRTTEDQNSLELGEMFRARAEVFHQRLGWNVVVRDGLERDRYDDLDPLYLLCIHDDAVAGSLRLLPTTGPTMMRDDFAGMFPGVVNVASPLIWECTRFCLHPWVPAALTRGVSVELMLGICQTALRAGIEQILGVYDNRMVKIYRRVGWEPEMLAESTSPSGPVFVGLWEVSDEAAARMNLRRARTSSITRFSQDMSKAETTHADTP